MAGGGGALSAERSKRGKASNRKKMKRVGFHLDMTPLVDITFLLLTFFMFTTTMAAPQVLEMQVPPEMDAQVEVKESQLLSIYVRNDNKLFYKMGLGDLVPIQLKEVRAISERENLNPNPEIKNKLIVALRCSNDAAYGTIVSILDELNLAETKITQEIEKGVDPKTGEKMKRERRFTIANLTDDDVALIKDL